MCKTGRDYKRWGGRGIKICDEWLNFEGFWLDMEKGYSNKLTLDRIDNNGNYCKENCRWIPMGEQSFNRRTSLKFKGECAAVASRRLGGQRDLVFNRIRQNWSKEDAFNTSVRTYKKLC